MKILLDVQLEEILVDLCFLGTVLKATIVFIFSASTALIFQYFWMPTLNYISAEVIIMMGFDPKSHRTDREFRVVNQNPSKTYFFRAS